MRIKGEGPKPCNVFLIGEAPGHEEDITGRPFVGKSGKELSLMLERNGINRRECYVTNICKERPPYVNGKQHAPTKEEIERDTPELIAELIAAQPKWIYAIGRVAARFFIGDHIDMESSHGLTYPLSVRVRDLVCVASGHSSSERNAGGDVHGVAQEWLQTCRVVPGYHPAAAMHNADLAPFVWWDTEQLGNYVNGKLHPVTPIDPYTEPRYTENINDLPNASLLYGGTVACDTEGLPGKVWGGSVSCEAGTALVNRVPNTQTLGAVLKAAERIIFHHSLHDVPILNEIGIDVDWEKVEDTFLMAYCLRLVPMGLKALSRRYHNMTMQAYLDVVAPADRSLAMEYVKKALAAKQCPLCDGTGKIKVLTKKGDRYKKDPVKCWYKNELGEKCDAGGIWVEREEQLKYDWDTGKWKITKGWSTGKYLNALKKDLETDKYELEDPETGEVQNVRERIGNWPDDVLGIIEAEIGSLPEPTLDDISAAAATYYSARDADATIRIYPILSNQIDALGLREAYRLDLSVIPVAAEMQKNGMHVDVAYFAEFVKRLEEDNQKILAKLESLAGRPINPASGDHVAALLFGERGLKITDDDERELLYSFDLEVDKWTKSRSRASTDDKTLEAVKLKYAGNKSLVEIVDLVIDYRVRHKILGTYAKKLPLMVDSASRIHTTIKPCRTATFRWASANPNLQNIPARPKGTVDLGKLVRKGFTAPEGYVLGSWDFDQIEMRVLAWYSQDANLLRVFRENIDIHCLTAALVFRVPFDQFMVEYKKGSKLRKDQRTSAKNIGFGVVYGVTARGLQAQMELRGQNWTLEECQALIDMYLYEAYPGVGRFMMDAHAEARRTGMVRSLFGHIRYCPGVHSSIPSVREEALRQAANFKIQATAAELLKVAMRKLYHECKPVLDALDVKILMAVHDELLLQVPDNSEIKDLVDDVVTEAMTDPVKLDGVSVSTSGKYAANWGLLKEVEDWKKVRKGFAH